MKNTAIAILGILKIVFAIYGFIQSIEAQRQAEHASINEELAKRNEAGIAALVIEMGNLRSELAKCQEASNQPK